MTIEVYGKKGCGVCSAAKEKLQRMGLSYSDRDLESVTRPHAGWRDDGSIEVLAALSLLDNRLPLIKIEGSYYDYPGAMRRLKEAGVGPSSKVH